MLNKEILNAVLENIDSLKARDVQTINVSKTSSITDYMVICSGNSKKHVQSIADHALTEAKHSDNPPIGIEGFTEGEWVLVDLGGVVLHVMQDATRDFYQLEKLWQASSSNDE
ncbi:ribosome silencing factor [Psychrosphaera sp. B3R10]|uniref:Ribosomal silencing factor RsfS n=1 Tax=Psychrosphaera algicola TaxID=3023714 RepID=A0ABT5FJN2_9GAMM|nr:MULTISPECIES: ribosome silencing factor [unclassified Psychrosphaera]MBU2880973.1 ribosome silencing factor [Psychrosphaera sp. I2R16]MBU2990808.1 ribosome silencing factor [Psychrosphaera sp. B3R10]MDC2891403.1 ribosome silencing factor [Psychrosphaera sp. G1-22]MDO6720504.1 ribosome silencing factor [Psychrosphaera sp. 1_MG-2023]